MLLLASSKSREKTLRGPELIKVCSSIFRNQQTNLHLGHRVMRAKHNASLCVQVCAQEFVKKYFFICVRYHSLHVLSLALCRLSADGSGCHTAAQGVCGGNPGSGLQRSAGYSCHYSLLKYLNSAAALTWSPAAAEPTHIRELIARNILGFHSFIVFLSQLSSCLSVIMLPPVC